MYSFFRTTARLRCFLLPICGVALWILGSCGKMPNAVDQHSEGSLEIHAYFADNALAKESTVTQTTFDSLIIEVSASDFKTIRQSQPISTAGPIVIDTMSKIPSGSNRSVKIYTVNKAGVTIHTDSTGIKTVTIAAGATTLINSVLIPAFGSIYFQIDDIPTNIDSLFASFTSTDNKVWSSHIKRSPKVYMSIDNVPNQTKGTLFVAAVDSIGDTLFSASLALTFDALHNSSIPLQFTTTPGGLAMTLSIRLPGITVVSGSLGAEQPAAQESGVLIITEIMYAVNDSEYVEVYNPGTADRTFDTLFLDLDGTYRAFTNITVASKHCFVFGRCPLPWVNAYPTSSSFLDLSSTGNWITIRAKDSTVIDQVIFAGGTNSLEWPVVSGKCSIVLDPSINDPISNNYGRNWHAATTLIDPSLTQYGTPGIR